MVRKNQQGKILEEKIMDSPTSVNFVMFLSKNTSS